ncbi:MAG TPA: GIY-YIG nuclease family protein [Xanthobacteraceae bacterium]
MPTPGKDISKERQGKAWLPEEEARLHTAFLSGVTIPELAGIHQRSRQAIRTRLIRMGVLKNDKVGKEVPVCEEHPCAWTYLLLSERGEVYLGATTDLRKRLRNHNSSDSRQWTRGRRWHLLAARGFLTRKEAFDFEADLKLGPHRKIKWKLQCLERAKKIVSRHNYVFSPADWSIQRKRK